MGFLADFCGLLMKRIKFRKCHRECEFGGIVEYYLQYGTMCQTLHISDIHFELNPYMRNEVARVLWQIRKELRQHDR